MTYYRNKLFIVNFIERELIDGGKIVIENDQDLHGNRWTVNGLGILTKDGKNNLYDAFLAFEDEYNSKR